MVESASRTAHLPAVIDAPTVPATDGAALARRGRLAVAFGRCGAPSHL
jgi:hypothetical protein